MGTPPRHHCTTAAASVQGCRASFFCLGDEYATGSSWLMLLFCSMDCVNAQECGCARRVYGSNKQQHAAYSQLAIQPGASACESKPASTTALGGQEKPSAQDSMAAASAATPSIPLCTTTAKRVRGCWLRLHARSARPAPPRSCDGGSSTARRPPALCAPGAATSRSMWCSTKAARAGRSGCGGRHLQRAHRPTHYLRRDALQAARAGKAEKQAGQAGQGRAQSKARTCLPPALLGRAHHRKGRGAGRALGPIGGLNERRQELCKRLGLLQQLLPAAVSRARQVAGAWAAQRGWVRPRERAQRQLLAGAMCRHVGSWACRSRRRSRACRPSRPAAHSEQRTLEHVLRLQLAGPGQHAVLAHQAGAVRGVVARQQLPG